MEIQDLLSITKCECGRKWCEYFAPAIGEYGASITRKELEIMLEDLPKVEKHLKELLKD